MKRFNSIAEIGELAGFKPDNPISTDRYRAIVGWYKFEAGHEVQCCVVKPNGGLCETKHINGWVVALSDDTLSIMGGDCARDKFSIDSIVSLDISRARNAIDQAELLARVRDAKSRGSEQRDAIKQLKRDLKDRDAALATLRGRLGKNAWRVLQNMAQQGSGEIVVRGIVPATYDNEGEIVSPRIEKRLRAGFIEGIQSCSEPRRFAARRDVDAIDSTLGGLLSNNEDELRGSDLRRLNASLADAPRAIAALESFINDMDGFLSNDFTSLALTLPSIEEKTAFLRSLRTLSKSQAKQLLQTLEAALKARFDVRRIEA